MYRHKQRRAQSGWSRKLALLHRKPRANRRGCSGTRRLARRRPHLNHHGYSRRALPPRRKPRANRRGCSHTRRLAPHRRHANRRGCSHTRRLAPRRRHANRCGCSHTSWPAPRRRHARHRGCSRTSWLCPRRRRASHRGWSHTSWLCPRRRRANRRGCFGRMRSGRCTPLESRRGLTCIRALNVQLRPQRERRPPWEKFLHQGASALAAGSLGRRWAGAWGVNVRAQREADRSPPRDRRSSCAIAHVRARARSVPRRCSPPDGTACGPSSRRLPALDK